MPSWISFTDREKVEVRLYRKPLSKPHRGLLRPAGRRLDGADMWPADEGSLWGLQQPAHWPERTLSASRLQHVVVEGLQRLCWVLRF